MPELRERLGTSEALTEWMAYYEVEPWGMRAADQRAALIATAAMLPHAKHKSGRPLVLTDIQGVPMSAHHVALLRDGDPDPNARPDETDEAELERFFEAAREGRR